MYSDPLSFPTFFLISDGLVNAFMPPLHHTPTTDPLKMLLFDILFGKERASISQLRKMLMQQICIFTTLNTITAIVSMTTNDMNYAERSAVVIGIILLYTSVPFGFYGAYRENGGVVSFFVMYGLLSGAARTVLRIVCTVMVASSCQMEQNSFMGCYLPSLPDAPVHLSCLSTSSCTGTDLSQYNSQRPADLRRCDAWSVSDCSNSPDTQTSMGFSGIKIFYLIWDVATACMPVYIAFLFLLRFEALRAHEAVEEEALLEAKEDVKEES